MNWVPGGWGWWIVIGQPCLPVPNDQEEHSEQHQLNHDADCRCTITRAPSETEEKALNHMANGPNILLRARVVNFGNFADGKKQIEEPTRRSIVSVFTIAYAEPIRPLRVWRALPSHSYPLILIIKL